MTGGAEGHSWTAIVVSGAFELVLNLVALAYFVGRLATRVEVLWLAVFNHLGQDAEAAHREWRAQRRKGHERNS